MYAHRHARTHAHAYSQTHIHAQIEVEKINKERLQEAFDLSFAIEFSQVCDEETTHLISKAKKQGQDDGEDNEEQNRGPSLLDIQSLVMKAKTTKAGSREPKGDSRDTRANNGDEASVASKGNDVNEGTYSSVTGPTYSDVDEEEQEEGDEKPTVADVEQAIDMTKPFMPVYTVSSASEAVRCVCIYVYVHIHVCMYTYMQT
jgi:hypothetical protein